MNQPEEIISRIKAARERYLLAVLEWRRERDASETKLRAAEHELAQSLARLFVAPEIMQRRAS